MRKNENYKLSDLLEFTIQNKARAVVFSNPCNPTGQGFSRDEVLEFIEKCPAICIIDEAYMDFWDQSILDAAHFHENLIVLKTLSKAFGGAGLRIGFATGHPSLVNAINVARSPYNVNTLSQTLAKFILQSEVDNSKFLYNQAQKLGAEIEKLLDGCVVYPTCANFIYVKYERSEFLYNELLKRGIALRCFKPDHLRITASTDEEMQILYKEIKDIIKI